MFNSSVQDLKAGDNLSPVSHGRNMEFSEYFPKLFARDYENTRDLIFITTYTFSYECEET
jgi:hypothetical protein